MRALIVGGAVLVALCAAAAMADLPYDIRLKRDVQSVMPQRGLDLVLALEPVTYWWSEDQVVFPQGGRQIGLIAQEVAEVLPDIIEDRGGFLYVDYDQIGPLLIGAVQRQQELILEQQARLTQQELDIADLQLRLHTLEAEP
jgi:hypothetical protein